MASGVRGVEDGSGDGHASINSREEHVGNGHVWDNSRDENAKE